MDRRVAGVVIGAALIAGCGSQDTTGGTGGQGDAAELPAAIECGTQYRPDAEQTTGAEDATLRVERDDGLAGGTGSLEFERMTLSVAYLGDAPEGRTVDVRVMSSAGDPLARTLYQIGATPLQEIDFAGGHGFTGLHYVDHAGAQLQVWCTAVAG